MNPEHPHLRTSGQARLAALLILALSTLMGCTSAGIVPQLTSGRLDDPIEGFPVRIGEVRDLREFQASPSRTFVPSLAGDLDDRALRAKAVGRMVNSANWPAANVVLEPPATVESLVAEAGARALRSAGYRVLDPEDAGFDEATAIDFDIRRLWMIQNPATLPPRARVDIEIRIVAPLLGFERGVDVAAARGVSAGGVDRALFRRALERGLDDWTEQAQAEFARTQRGVERASPQR